MPDSDPARAAARGRLAFRPRPSRGRPGGVDEPLGLEPVRDGLLYVPDTAAPGAPLLVFLHGAGGSARREFRLVLAAADRYGVAVAAPDSRGPTWDVLLPGGMGPDISFIDRMLESAIERSDVDQLRIAIGGVSDGASYALTVGLSNGDVFQHVIAFSPGFIATGEPLGRPAVFVSHGTADPILPIDGCSRVIVPALRDAGYGVEYVEFVGGHLVPPEVADRGLAWLTGRSA